MNGLRSALVLPVLLLAVFTTAGRSAHAVEPKFDSKLVTTATPGHAVEVDVDIAGAKQLFLVVNDGGNGYACDWADWAEPRLIGPGGEKKLTELKWKSASADWGRVRIDRNCEGGPLRINGKPVEYGIGTHANSVIAYDLPPGYTKFKARAGLDNGGTGQQGGRATSVRFLVYLEQPPAFVVQGGSGGEDSGQRDPSLAVANLDVADGLEATLFASEPMMLSPSNIDVDHLGRVWVCEIVNYRHRNGSRLEGDRILILEDTTGDGKADKSTVFYQGRDIDSALGICVLGNKVIVSVAPNVFVFTDETGDGKADKKELLFTKVGQPQHDHSTHAFVFGPDGKLYWNVGNTGKHVHDKDGKLIVDKAGNPVIDNGKPYWGGMVFRCNLDGGEFEVLGHNFRNNYEVAVDSFGTLWQSDNDDDGNRACRINFVMEFGNYGYLDEFTGAGWRTPRTGMHEEIPLRHWHLRDPGVVPNLLNTGAGSPTGICVYEGRLLPEAFWDQMIHCDAGPNIVRAYPVKNDGAGYAAEIVNILEGTRDKWFRPADVCVAPDGSLIVADWYDPGVGGHRMGDIERGRLFRVAPPNTPYRIPQFDFSTPEGAAEALKSPNHAARYLAWTALHDMQAQAEQALKSLWKSDNPRHRARALWLLGKIDGRGRGFVEEALNDADSNLRITGLRLARQLDLDVIPYVRQLLDDPSPQVRRECAIALRHHPSPEMPKLWAELAARHDGKDRWYLEALGIAADRQWDACLDAWLARVGGQWNTPAGRDVIWRSRAATTPGYLAQILGDSSIPSAELPRYLRAFDFQQAGGKNEALIHVAFGTSGDGERRNFLATEALSRLRDFDVNKNPQHRAALDRVLDDNRGTEPFVQLIDQFGLSERYPELLATAQERTGDQVGIAAVRVLLSKRQQPMIRQALGDDDAETASATIRVLGNSGDGRIVPLLLPLAGDSKRPIELRRQAVRALAQTRNGAQELIKQAREQKLDQELHAAAGFTLNVAPWDDVKQQAAELFPLPPAKDSTPLPPVSELLKQRGDARRGEVVFNTTGTCANCHVVGGNGKEVGPNLSEIGDKLSKEAFYESILFPSAGISHNYETHTVALTSGNVVTGIIVSRTPDSISLRSADAITRTFKLSEIEEMQKQNVSLMPADLQKVMTQQDLVDVVEYMMTLKKTKPTPAASASK